MAIFDLSALATDKLIGTDDVADTFRLDRGSHLVGTDTVAGGSGALAEDRLVLGKVMNLAAAAFAGVRGIERLVMNASGGSVVSLADAMVASTDAGAFSVSGREGNDIVRGGAVVSTALRMSGGAGDDQLLSGGGADRLGGGSGNDTLQAGAGDDFLSGGTGDDRLDAGTGADRVDGGAGNDLILFDGGALDLADRIADESGAADTLQFTGDLAVSFLDALSGRVSGIERFVFGSGADVFAPGANFGDGVDGVVTVEGGGGDDNLSVAAVAPLTVISWALLGGAGADTLVGGRGDDTLDAGAGLGKMVAGEGDDLLIVMAEDLDGSVAIDGGGEGQMVATDGDTLRLVGSVAVSAAMLANVTGIEILELDSGGGDVEIPDELAAGVSSVLFDLRIVGSAEDDRIVTTALASGRDIVVQAGQGDDTVIGGAGDDTVFGGGGVDTLQLGAGADRAVFAAGELNAFDTVSADAGVAGDVLEVGLVAGRTLAQSAFAGVSGFDSFVFSGVGGGAVRLPGSLVTQSGLGSVSVSIASGAGSVTIDGRGVAGSWSVTGGGGDDLLFGGSGVNTLSGGGGADTIVGGDGGDVITLSGTGDRDLALITSIFDGTIDINGTLSSLSLAGADQVSGLTSESNYIAVDWKAVGLASGATLFLGAGQDVEFGFGANVLPTTVEIAGNAFGSLTAVRNAVGSLLADGAVGVDDSTILVIGGADETQFGVYYFQDRDDNATVDVADLLMLLAIGNGDVPTFNSGRGFTLSSLDLFA